MTQRRKLAAVDDPLALGGAAPSSASPARQTSSRELPALFVRLPVEQAESLARAAFELKVHKRELVAALVATYVATSPEGLVALRELVEDFRRSG